MRYYELYEQATIDDDEAVNAILERCKPYLKQNPRLNPIYRGFDQEGIRNIVVKNIRKDRQPVHTSGEISAFIDNSLLELGARAIRSNSIYVTSDRSEAATYGFPHVIFPIGKFSYTWSSEVTDLFIFIQENRRSVMDLDEDKLDRYYQRPETQARVLKSVVHRKIADLYQDPETEFAVLKRAKEEQENSPEVKQEVNNIIEKSKELFKRYYVDEDNKALAELSNMPAVPAYQTVSSPSKHKIHDLIENYYRFDVDLEEAIASENEIMISGDKYIAVPHDVYDTMHNRLKERLG